METITYNLRNDSSNSDQFYYDLSVFTDYALGAMEYDVSYEIKNFQRFQHSQKTKPSRNNDIFLEMLIMGVLMEQHGNKALGSNKFARKVSKFLFDLRKKNDKHKAGIDKLRGYISTVFLAGNGKAKYIHDLKGFKEFIDWLKATGEYEQEYKKMLNWEKFFSQLTHAEISFYLSKAYNIAGIFEKDAKKQLGKYTKNVSGFQHNHLSKKRYREDYLFCGKNEVEYHLNMVGAQILNMSLNHDFEKTSKKILMLPTCMCQPETGTCKAFNINDKLYCSGCSKNCNVNSYKEYCQKNGISLNLLPHSTSFSKYLKAWKDQKEVGLIGVACVPNLLAGGYEMMKLNIPSQCIFLDYCGCKKHWHKNGIATDINLISLEKMAQEESYKALISTFS